MTKSIFELENAQFFEDVEFAGVIWLETLSLKRDIPMSLLY